MNFDKFITIFTFFVWILYLVSEYFLPEWQFYLKLIFSAFFSRVVAHAFLYPETRDKYFKAEEERLRWKMLFYNKENTVTFKRFPRLDE